MGMEQFQSNPEISFLPNMRLAACTQGGGISASQKSHFHPQLYSNLAVWQPDGCLVIIRSVYRDLGNSFLHSKGSGEQTKKANKTWWGKTAQTLGCELVRDWGKEDVEEKREMYCLILRWDYVYISFGCWSIQQSLLISLKFSSPWTF